MQSALCPRTPQAQQAAELDTPFVIRQPPLPGIVPDSPLFDSDGRPIPIQEVQQVSLFAHMNKAAAEAEFECRIALSQLAKQAMPTPTPALAHAKALPVAQNFRGGTVSMLGVNMATGKFWADIRTLMESARRYVIASQSEFNTRSMEQGRANMVMLADAMRQSNAESEQIPLAILTNKTVSSTVLRESWLKDADEHFENVPVHRRGRSAAKHTSAEVSSSLKEQLDPDGDLDGRLPESLTIQQLREALKVAFPTKRVEMEAWKQFQGLACKSPRDWVTFVTDLKKVYKNHPDSVGKSPDSLMQNKVMTVLNVVDQKLHDKLQTDWVVAPETAPISWRTLASVIRSRFGAVNTLNEEKKSDLQPTPLPHVLAGKRPFAQPAVHRKKSKTMAAHLTSIRSYGLAVNRKALESGTCSVCSDGDKVEARHIAVAGQCPKVDALVAGGSKWCNHCSMANHTEQECGHLHPGLNAGKGGDRKSSPSKRSRGDRVKSLEAKIAKLEAVQTDPPKPSGDYNPWVGWAQPQPDKATPPSDTFTIPRPPPMQPGTVVSENQIKALKLHKLATELGLVRP